MWENDYPPPPPSYLAGKIQTLSSRETRTLPPQTGALHTVPESPATSLDDNVITQALITMEQSLSAEFVSDNTSQSNLTRASSTLIPSHTAVASAVKLPPFWRDTPEIWYSVVKGMMSNCKIEEDTQKYNTLLGAMEPEIAKKVENVIKNPPATCEYKKLRETILSRFAESSDQKLKKLFDGVELQGKKLISLLRHLGC